MRLSVRVTRPWAELQPGSPGLLPALHFSWNVVKFSRLLMPGQNCKEIFGKQIILKKIIRAHCYPNKPVILPLIRFQETIAQLDDAWRSDAGAATDMSQTPRATGSAENTYTAVISHCFSPRSQIDSVAFHSSGIFYISHQRHWNLKAYFDILTIKSRTDGIALRCTGSISTSAKDPNKVNVQQNKSNAALMSRDRGIAVGKCSHSPHCSRTKTM